MAVAPSRAEELLLPARPGFIALTFIGAALLALLPWSGTALLVRPDFVAVVLLYWCIREPRRVGIGIAWALGLLMDVGYATLFGQNALAYSVLAFLGLTWRRRVLMFGPGGQVLHVAPMLVAEELVSLLVALAGGAPFPGWAVFLAALTGAALWPALSLLFTLPQKPKADPDAL
ncbi:MAG: rod shape-determining protein MreD [Azospira oryzae]|nr:MAG: rod shape-determining protein MreD [Azospira oryzae]PZP56425.1 MAG: rod shape-determining protein MreD [Delftia acidovorans]PZP75083.1 MAG: rod shape-determining protein MreD [Azospira oryzae]